MSNNWVVENLENALETWNSKLSEIWRLLSESPTEFKGGGIWNVMVNINDALKAVGYALLVLFFLMGIMRQFNSFQEIKRPEQALKLFIRFVLAKAAVTWGLDLMMAMFTIVQGIISKIMIASGLNGNGATYLPQSMIQTIEDCGFWESIPAGIKRAGSEISSYWEQLKMIVNPDTKLYKEVGGFIAIGSVFPDEWNWQSFWNITALISIILAVMNLLPIPGLDGGHALFTLWEIITRRKPSDKFMEVMQWIGLAILFALLIYANGNDILKLFN